MRIARGFGSGSDMGYAADLRLPLSNDLNKSYYSAQQSECSDHRLHEKHVLATANEKKKSQ